MKGKQVKVQIHFIPILKISWEKIEKSKSLRLLSGDNVWKIVALVSTFQ